MSVIDESGCTGYGVVERQVDSLVKRLPPLDEETIRILGRPNFACAGIAQFLRTTGQEIKTRSEDEQAAAIHWMMNLYLDYGNGWRDEAKKLMSAGA